MPTRFAHISVCRPHSLPAFVPTPGPPLWSSETGNALLLANCFSSPPWTIWSWPHRPRAATTARVDMPLRSPRNGTLPPVRYVRRRLFQNTVAVRLLFFFWSLAHGWILRVRLKRAGPVDVRISNPPVPPTGPLHRASALASSLIRQSHTHTPCMQFGVIHFVSSLPSSSSSVVDRLLPFFPGICHFISFRHSLSRLSRSNRIRIPQPSSSHDSLHFYRRIVTGHLGRVTSPRAS